MAWILGSTWNNDRCLIFRQSQCRIQQPLWNWFVWKVVCFSYTLCDFVEGISQKIRKLYSKCHPLVQQQEDGAILLTVFPFLIESWIIICVNMAKLMCFLTLPHQGQLRVWHSSRWPASSFSVSLLSWLTKYGLPPASKHAKTLTCNDQRNSSI